ncbi:hypothetical protein ACTWM0_04285 [Pseudomonas machongensis]
MKVAYLNDNQKVWFIRASSGAYARNFRFGKLIAIKHLEEAMGNALGSEIPSEESIKDQLLKNPKYYEFVEDNKTKKNIKTLNRAGTNLLGQIKRFANDICAGDLIVTKNEDGGYSVGICTDSNAYISSEVVELPRPNEEAPAGPTLRYKLRKHVLWGPSITQANLPHSVRRATRGQQTVTNLSGHKEKIFHLIYPFFTDGESLYFSNKIRRQSDINALVIGKLFENVSLAEELIEALLSDAPIDVDAILNSLNLKLFSGGDLVTCKAEFMSPGDMWCKIPLSQAVDLIPQLVAGVFVCLLLTGQATASEFAEGDKQDSFEVAVGESTSSGIFNEKFKAAKPSKALKALQEKIKSKQQDLSEVESKRSTSGIKENLRLGLTDADTAKLEGFEYGINIIELRGSRESR